ncbi:MAG TPA: hypothetical protein PLJ74_13550 [Myxococcota bacterium]|nr:hypothetical protein [Myxococcota bacterium]
MNTQQDVVRASIENIDPQILNSKVQNIRKELSRHRIAIWFIWGYLILLTLAFAAPTVLYVVSKPANSLTVADLKDLLQAFSGALTGLTGILGFVVGYYFKGEEHANQTAV